MVWNYMQRSVEGQKGKMGRKRTFPTPPEDCDSVMMKIQIFWNDTQGAVRTS